MTPTISTLDPVTAHVHGLDVTVKTTLAVGLLRDRGYSSMAKGSEVRRPYAKAPYRIYTPGNRIDQGALDKKSCKAVDDFVGRLVSGRPPQAHADETIVMTLAQTGRGNELAIEVVFHFKAPHTGAAQVWARGLA